MRRARQLARSWPGRLILVTLILYSTVVSRSTVPLAYADTQIAFVQCSKPNGTFTPVGIDFGFRSNVAGLFNEDRMYVSSLPNNKPAELYQCNANATKFSLRAQLQFPSPAFMSVIPAVVGTQQTTAGGFSSNHILVTQFLTVFDVSGAGDGSVTPTVLTTIPAGTGSAQSQCTSPKSRIVVDPWRLQFGGKAIFVCTGSSFTEIWKISLDTSTMPPTPVTMKFLTLSGTVVSGRFGITSPNFLNCGGCLAVVADNSSIVTLIDGVGIAGTISLGTTTTGANNVVTVPPRVFPFGSSGGCLFGTTTLFTINQFPCTTPFPPAVFTNTVPGDLLIFTQIETVLRVAAVNQNVSPVASSAGVYQDLAFSNLRKAGLLVQQPSVSNPNPGELGNIVFYILSSPGFIPGTDVNVATILFGRTGSENSVSGRCMVTGEDKNRDGVPDLKCFAVATVANCNAPAICIVTGSLFGPDTFDGP